jgi:hypothetical protein
MDALARIGINEVTRSAFFSLLGLPNMDGLAMFTKDSIKTLCAQMRDWILKREYERDGMELSATSERYLVAMASWVKERVMMRLKVKPEDFTLDEAQDMAVKLTLKDEAVAAAKDYKPPMPEKFKTSAKYKNFKEAVQNYLSQLTGIIDVPLVYVIRDEKRPNRDGPFTTETERLIANAPLKGDAFEKDNQKVYAILKNLCLEGEARPYIKVPKIESSQDGRGLWTALKEHYEGNGYRTKEINEAHTAIEGLHYKREYQTFTFETFVGQLTEHYNTLERHGVPVSEEQKVNSLFNKVTDPTMDAAKEALQMERYKNPELVTFVWAANHLATKVKTIKRENPRNISGIQGQRDDQNNSGRGGRGGRGGGRGRSDGRGRGRGRSGGRGRGRGSGNPYAGYYSPDDWSKLNKEQRDKILEIRKRHPEKNGGGQDKKRGIAAVEQDSTLENDNETQTPKRERSVNAVGTESPTDNNANAGQQFGRAGHRAAGANRYIS